MLFIMLLLLFIIVFFYGYILGLKFSNKEIHKMKNLAFKNYELLICSINWIKNYDKVEKYILKGGYKKIAIYGMSYLGQCLEETLRKKDIKVICGIDRNASQLYNMNIPIYNSSDNLPEVDVVIVTAVTSYQQIESNLKKKNINIDIVSLEDILK